MGLLDKPLQENTRSDGNTLPLCFGEVFNCEPLLLNPITLEYQVNEGEVESIVVRDNGVDITSSCTIDLLTGTFTLGAARVGKITCDVIEQHKTLAQIVEFIALRFNEQIDTINLNAFPNDATLGYYLRDSITASQVLLDLASSLGAFPRFSLLGQLQLVRLDLASSAQLTIDDNEIVADGLSLDNVQPPMTAMHLMYQKNWGIQNQDALAGAVSSTNRALYSQDYSAVESVNSLSGYPLATPRTVETYIASESAAQAESGRRATLRSVARQVWRVQAFLSASQVSIGDPITIEYPHFGYDQTRTGAVLSLRKNLLADDVELEVFI
jgi:hypothetical protein